MKPKNVKLINQLSEIVQQDSKVERLKKSIEINKEVATKFGRFLLKEATQHWDKDLTLCWKIKDEEFDTEHLYNKFIEENF